MAQVRRMTKCSYKSDFEIDFDTIFNLFYRSRETVPIRLTDGNRMLTHLERTFGCDFQHSVLCSKGKIRWKIWQAVYYYTPRNEVVGGYTGFTMSVCPSVDKSYVVR